MATAEDVFHLYERNSRHYYDNLDEVNSLLTVKNIESAYNYLRKLDKTKLHINTFIKNFDDILRKID